MIVSAFRVNQTWLCAFPLKNNNFYENIRICIYVLRKDDDNIRKSVKMIFCFYHLNQNISLWKLDD
jgi:hypothetical protein